MIPALGFSFDPFPFVFFADIGIDLFPNLLPAKPLLIIVTHQIKRWKILGQIPPLTTRFIQVVDRI